ncbi:MAG TPA: hypothetical protein VK196_03305 [Magnetospirillum sp.]|nr:hypothetical protein [Magnetospirillum sp.]
MANYPPIKPEHLLALRAIAAAVEADPAYLGAAPYDAAVKTTLRQWFGAARPVPPPTPTVLDVNDPTGWGDVSAMARQTFADLERLPLADLEPSEVVAVARAKAALLERLIAVGEKALGHKQVAEFKAQMFQVVDGLDADTRNRFIESVEALADLEERK